MAIMRNPFDTLPRPRTGPNVQNTGGLAPNTAPIASRPVSSPGVRLGRPGPELRGGGSLAPRPSPAGPIVTPGAQAARQRASARSADAQRRVSSLSKQQYGRGGGTSDVAGSLGDQIRQALSGMFSGQTSQGFIDRSRSALGSAIEGRRAQAERRINDDAIRRGVFQSGIPGAGISAANTSADNAFATGLADILSQAENQDIQGRQFATGAGTNLLGMNRSFDQMMQNRIDAARRSGGGGPGTTTIIDPDTGQSYEVEESLLRYL